MKTLSAIVFLFLSGLPAPASETPSVRPVGIQVAWPAEKGKYIGSVFPNFSKPLRLVLVLDSGGRQIAGIDEDACTLESLTDDRGKDLKGRMGTPRMTGPNRDRVRLTVIGGEAPSAGARSIRATGSVELRTGTSETKRGPLVAAKFGETARISEQLEFQIQTVKHEKSSEFPFVVTLGIGRDIPEVAALRFFDRNGKEIPSEALPEKRLDIAGRARVARTYLLARAVDEFRLEAEIRNQVETFQVPFDVKVGAAAHNSGQGTGASPPVRVAGFEVVWQTPGPSEPKGWGIFNPWQPVRLILEADAGGKEIAGMTWPENKVILLEDGSGNTLRGKPWLAQISTDRKSARFEILAKPAPPVGVASFHLKGVAKFRSASGETTKQSPLLPVKARQTVRIAENLQFKLTKVGKSRSGHAFRMKFQIHRQIPEVAAFHFLDENGKEVPIMARGNGSARTKNGVVVAYEFEFDRKFEKFQMEVDLWDDMKTSVIPFDLSMDLGGP